MLIIQCEVIPGTIIDVVHEAIECHNRFGVTGLQWDGNIRDRIAYGEEIYRRLGASGRTADDNPVIALGIVVLHSKRQWLSDA